jgi:CPA1 family monovalent cation:H+ antiporter
MTFLESLLALLLIAIALLQVSRRLALPYPAMLAAAGVVVAYIPGVPLIRIDPQIALALFIAPVLLDAAFDFPASAARRLWRPLLFLAGPAVLLTAAVVAWIGWAWAGLPLAAAVALGAIVAPPDAAAATAILGQVSLPRRIVATLRGESLFNDATALLLFAAALAVQASGGLHAHTVVQIALAPLGGVLLGVAAAYVYQWLNAFVEGTLGGNLLQFVNGIALWVVAEHLHLSAVLCIVAFAMTIAVRARERQNPRMRVQSFAVWSAVVFFLNVLAFLLMGLQVRTLISGMAPQRLDEALTFAGLVVLAVIVVRLVVVLGYRAVANGHARLTGRGAPLPVRESFLIGWCGMRGLVSLAAAFALPANFPQRDLVLLAAFGVVLATLVLQGLTLVPMIKLLGLDQKDRIGREAGAARGRLVDAALGALEPHQGPEAENLRYVYGIQRQSLDGGDAGAEDRWRELGILAITAKRGSLGDQHRSHEIGTDTFYDLQEQLDWQELSLLPDEARRIEEN